MEKTFKHTPTLSMAPNFMQPGGEKISPEKRKDVEQQYYALLAATEAITAGEYYPKSDQERRDLGSWALKLVKSRALYPFEAEKALIYSGAVFKDNGYRRFARDIITDIHYNMGDSHLAHDTTAETWRLIDEGEETLIAKAALRAQITAEEAHGIYQEEMLRHTLAAKALENEKKFEEQEREEALKNATTLDIPEEETVPYDPFADEDDFDLVPVRRKTK